MGTINSLEEARTRLNDQVGHIAKHRAESGSLNKRDLNVSEPRNER